MVGDQLSQSNQANLSAMNATIQTTPNTRPERSIQLGSARQHPARASVVQAMQTPKPIWAVVRQKYPKSKQRINLSRLITRSGFIANMTTVSITITRVVTQHAVKPGRRHNSDTRLRGGSSPAAMSAVARDMSRGEGSTIQLTTFRRSIWIALISESQFRIPTIPIATAAINSMSWPRRGLDAAGALTVHRCEAILGTLFSWSIMRHAFSYFSLSATRRF
jgi:hypothetical protein